MANIFNLPDFMFTGIDSKNLSKIKKIAFLLKGLFLSYVHKKTDKKLFCRILNIFYSSDGKIYYENGKYFKTISENKILYFPNKRIDRVVVDYKKHLSNLLDQYSIQDFKLNEKDLVIDCGANVGELYFSLSALTKNFDYIAFEPDPKAFECLLMNLDNDKNKLYNVALSDNEGQTKLFIDTFGANSSIEFFGKDRHVLVETRTLDSFNFEKAKLIKLEAEGHELEILNGSVNTLKRTEFITVDYGPEKGEKGKMTLPEVTNFLYQNGYVIENSSSKRFTSLFKNLNFP